MQRKIISKHNGTKRRKDRDEKLDGEDLQSKSSKNFDLQRKDMIYPNLPFLSRWVPQELFYCFVLFPGAHQQKEEERGS